MKHDLTWFLALILELNIEQDEYIDESNIEAGVRVLLSDQEVFLFPVEEGFSVEPGVSASVSLNRVCLYLACLLSR